MNNKVAIVTGASRGIGYAVARLYALNGAKVVVCGRNLEGAVKAVEKLILEDNIDKDNLMAVGLDVQSIEQIKKCVSDVIEKWGRINVLVNNAGITSNHSFLESTDEDFRKMFDINFFGVVSITREVVKYMKEYGGSIINTGSMVGLYGGNHQAEYASSKFAIHGLTKSLAKELGVYNIRVNAVSPGVVKTDMMSDFVSDEMASRLEAMTPLKRMASIDDLAGAYLFLAGDSAKFITGAIVQVDGGIIM